MTKESEIKYAKRIKTTYFVRYDYFNLHEIIATKKTTYKSCYICAIAIYV